MKCNAVLESPSIPRAAPFIVAALALLMSMIDVCKHCQLLVVSFQCAQLFRMCEPIDPAASGDDDPDAFSTEWAPRPAQVGYALGIVLSGLDWCSPSQHKCIS